MDIIPVLRRLRQGDGHKFKASLGYLVSLCIEGRRKEDKNEGSKEHAHVGADGRERQTKRCYQV